MMNVLKMVFLGIVGFGVLVYLTAPEQNPKSKSKQVNLSDKVTIAMLPNYLEVIGKGSYFVKEKLIKKGEVTYLIVANHDSLAVLNKLYNFTKKNVILVANISNTPWLIKKLAVDGKLEELYKDSKIPMINDASGTFVKTLKLSDTTQNAYFIYKIDNNGNIVQINKGIVKLNALEKGISSEESTKTLQDISKLLN